MALDVQSLLESLSDAPDVSQGPVLERVIWTLLAFSIIIVALRFYAKIKKARRLFVDDYLMLIALAFAIAHAALTQVSVDAGLGRHLVYIPLGHLPRTMKYGVLSLLPGFLSPMFGRLSFSYTLLYLIDTDARIKSWPVYASIFMQAAINIIGVIVFYSQCGSEVDAFWKLEKQLRFDEICWNPRIQTDYGYFMGSWNTVTDFYLAVLPAILIHHSTMSLKRKVGVAALLCLSFLAMASSIVKTYEAKVLSVFSDYTYSLCAYVIALSVELNVVIITASLPFLRPLVPKKWQTRQQPLPALHDIPIHQRTRQGHIPLSSGYTSKNHSRTNTIEMTSPISPTSPNAMGFQPAASGNWVLRSDHGAITVTTEVEVTYEKMEAPFVHAALVGLIQGEIMNPRLRRV
ncbi:hypothetical protein CKM354_000251700 [Cercospora kikuchii]|uniref:Rhodopsin domain-containing protein n=1 Tax=Cercospora kikuchii TaxID=84275 RepID=A0A9P3CCL2_9PEZI|nr:uncharacterized protein CKM354_000251700 [Cercospora kikuchii]GIZ39126.1 hypothetical protein CKM354_000251700 [Cercospora kikuchii]